MFKIPTLQIKKTHVVQGTKYLHSESKKTHVVKCTK